MTGAVDEFGNRLGESEDLLRGSLGAYDPMMTEQFYNPYEDRVVQQTIDDIMEAGDKQDIAARAQAISAGGESAFGSRARLGAEERRESLGRGLAEALGNIRSRGFSEAQQTGMGEFARQRQAERAAASGLGGFAGSRLGAGQSLAGNLQQYGQSAAGARSGLAGGLLGIGQQRGAGASGLGAQLAQYGGQMAGIGSNLEGLNRGQRSELMGLGSTARGIQETGFGRQQATTACNTNNRQEIHNEPMARHRNSPKRVNTRRALERTLDTRYRRNRLQSNSVVRGLPV